MSFTRKELNQEVADMEGRIKGLAHKIKCTRTNMQNPELARRMIAKCEANIAAETKRKADLEYALEHGHDIIEETKKEIEKLRKKLVRTKHQRDIEKMLELQRLINEAQRELGEADDEA